MDGIYEEALSKADKAIAHLLRQVEPLAKGNLTLEQLLKGNPETTRLARLFDQLPLFVEVVLHNIISQSVPTTALLSGDFEGFCKSSLESFTFPPGTELDFGRLKDTLCSINFTVVSTELQEFLDVKTIQDIVSLKL